MLAVNNNSNSSDLLLYIIIGAFVGIIFGVIFLIVKNKRAKIKEKNDFNHTSQTIIEALGGKDNIISCEVIMSRLNVVLNDYKMVDNQKLTDVGVSGTVKTSKKLTLIVGKLMSQQLCDIINEIIKKDI